MRSTLLKIALIAALLILGAWQLDLEAFAQALSLRLLAAAAAILPLMALGLLAVSVRFSVLTGMPGMRLAVSYTHLTLPTILRV